MTHLPFVSNDFFQKSSATAATAAATTSTAYTAQDLSLWDTVRVWIQYHWNEGMTSSIRSTIVVTIVSLLVCLGFAASSFSDAVRTGWQKVVQPIFKSPFQRIQGPRQSDPDTAHYHSLANPGQPNTRPRSGSNDSTISSSSKLGNYLFWDDLQHPFGQEPVDNAYVESPDMVHFCFLLHGHRGLSKDLSYMQVMMQQVAQEEKKHHSTHDMVVHLSAANEGKTTDGVAKGGDRLVEELRTTIIGEMIKRHPELSLQLQEDNSVSRNDKEENNSESPVKMYNISISILGNSLGGLFGRYAIAKLIERHCVWNETTNVWILDGRFRLMLNIFCTTATPHLGVSRHTYVKIPRTAEIGVAHALGDTGRDLFRLNDLLHTMSTSSTFLKPLGAFRKRVAYANAYGTDFAVPVSTAAFLSEHSTYPHRIVQTNRTAAMTNNKSSSSVSASSSSSLEGGENSTELPAGGLVIATLYTPAWSPDNESLDDGDHGGNNTDACSGTPYDELDEMSQSLDRLGWKKVFVDMRQELPNAELPSILRPSPSATSLSDVDDLSNGGGASTGAPSLPPTAIPKLQALQMENRLVESREVALAVSSPEDNRIALPLGHNMIVAFSRSPWSTFMNKGGRPVVDALAKELVQDIFHWEQTNGAGNDDNDPTCLEMMDRRCSPVQQ